MKHLIPSICTINWRFEKKLPQILETISAQPFRAVEIWTPHLATLPISKVKALLIEYQLEPLCLAVPWNAFFWEHEPALLHYATALKAKGIKIFADILNHPALLHQRLSDFCKVSKKAGLEVYLETHSGQPHDTVPNTLSILEAVKAPNLKIIFDLFNSHELGENVMESYKAYGPHLAHLHLKWGHFSADKSYCPESLKSMPAIFHKVLNLAAKDGLACSLEMMTDTGHLKEGLEIINKADCAKR